MRRSTRSRSGRMCPLGAQALEARDVPAITISGYEPAAGRVTFTGAESDDNLELFPVALASGQYALGHNLTDPNLASNTDLDPTTPGDQQLILQYAFTDPQQITVDLKGGNDTRPRTRSASGPGSSTTGDRPGPVPAPVREYL